MIWTMFPLLVTILFVGFSIANIYVMVTEGFGNWLRYLLRGTMWWVAMTAGVGIIEFCLEFGITKTHVNPLVIVAGSFVNTLFTIIVFHRWMIAFIRFIKALPDHADTLKFRKSLARYRARTGT